MSRQPHGSPGDTEYRPETRRIFICTFADGFAIARPARVRALLTMRSKPSLRWHELQHLMHVDHDAVGVARGGRGEQALHQPAIFFSSDSIEPPQIFFE
jgi:hypothetical protein